MSEYRFLETRDRESFERGMNAICNELVSVATNYARNEDRTCLSAYFEGDDFRPSSDGWLIAVRDDEGVPLEILLMARDLHGKIQQHYRNQEAVES